MEGQVVKKNRPTLPLVILGPRYLIDQLIGGNAVPAALVTNSLIDRSDSSTGS